MKKYRTLFVLAVLGALLTSGCATSNRDAAYARKMSRVPPPVEKNKIYKVSEENMREMAKNGQVHRRPVGNKEGEPLKIYKFKTFYVPFGRGWIVK